VTIPGFAPHGSRFRALVSLEPADAREVAAEAGRRGVSVARVLEDRVRSGRKGAGDKVPD
jgi:hypothetical protein